MSGTGGSRFSVRLWDLPVRICHWAFVVLLPAMWWTAEQRDIQLHSTLGLIFLALVVFRLFWGFAGSEPARFGQFLKGPTPILAYLKAGKQGALGHNPIGGWSVFFMLGLLSLQIGLGLITQDVDGLESGPLNYLVDFETAESAREWHELTFNAIVGMVVLHIGAIMFYLLRKKDNLIHPMITGKKTVDSQIESPRLAPPISALVCALASAAIAVWISMGAPF